MALNNQGPLPPHQDWVDFVLTLSILSKIRDFTLQLTESQHQEQETLAKEMARPILRPTDHSFGLEPEEKTFSSYFNRQGGRNNLRRIFVDGAAIFDNGPNVANYWTGRSPNDVLRTDHLLRVLLELVVRGHFVIVLIPSSFRCGRMTVDDPGLLRELEKLAILKYCEVSYCQVQLLDAQLQVGMQLKLLASLCARLKPAELPLEARRQLDVVRRVADRLHRRHIERLDEHDSDDDDDGSGPIPSDPLPVLEAAAAIQNAVLDDDWE